MLERNELFFHTGISKHDLFEQFTNQFGLLIS